MIEIDTTKEGVRISQGDIYKDIEYLEYAIEKEGYLEISKIVFPLVIVLTQDCDLEQDARIRDAFEKVQQKGNKDSPTEKTQDKFLLSVLVAPLYNAEHFFMGEHLDKLEMTMNSIKKTSTEARFIQNNTRPRYHYLKFPDDVPIVDSVIDFKHYFSVNVSYLRNIKDTHFVRKVSSLYREQVCQRFANYLSRIGLPNQPQIKQVI